MGSGWGRGEALSVREKNIPNKRAFGAGSRHASLDLFLGILGTSGRDQPEGGTWYGASAKPARLRCSFPPPYV